MNGLFKHSTTLQFLWLWLNKQTFLLLFLSILINVQLIGCMCLWIKCTNLLLTHSVTSDICNKNKFWYWKWQHNYKIIITHLLKKLCWHKHGDDNVMRMTFNVRIWNACVTSLTEMKEIFHTLVFLFDFDSHRTPVVLKRAWGQKFSARGERLGQFSVCRQSLGQFVPEVLKQSE